MIRIVDKSYYNAHTEPIFKKLNLLKFQDIHLLHLGQFMFSFKNSILGPRKFKNIFTTNNQIHNYNTRHANSFRQYHYVEQISGNSPFFIKVRNFLALFLLRLLALHLSRPLGKNLKVLLSYYCHNSIVTNMTCQYFILPYCLGLVIIYFSGREPKFYKPHGFLLGPLATSFLSLAFIHYNFVIICNHCNHCSYCNLLTIVTCVWQIN